MSGRLNHESDVRLLIIYAEYCFSDNVHVYLLGGFIAIHASKFRIQATAPGQPSPRLHRGSRCLPPPKQQLHQVEPTRRGSRACPSHPRQHSRLLPANNQFLERRVVLKIDKQPSAPLQLGAQSRAIMLLEIRRAAPDERVCVRLAVAEVVPLRQAPDAVDEQVDPVSSVNEVANERLDRRAVQVGLQRRDLRARPLEHPGRDGVTLALVRVEQRQVRRGQLPA